MTDETKEEICGYDWDDLIEEDYGEIDALKKKKDKTPFPELLYSLGYLEEVIEDYRGLSSETKDPEEIENLNVEIDDDTYKDLNWGEVKDPVVLNLPDDATEILGELDEDCVNYEGRYVELEKDPEMVIGFGTQKQNSRKRFKTENMEVSAPNIDS